MYISPDTPIGASIRDVAALFHVCGVDDPKVSARFLAQAACNFSAAELVARMDEPLGASAAEKLVNFVARRLRHEPVSRILGRRHFWRNEFLIDPSVLDPRPETELILETALARLAARRNEPLRILDLGTGSGALLCALLQEFPASVGTGVDLSRPACRIATENLQRLGLSARGSILNSNWRDQPIDDEWDLIVSNPPYIASGQIADLSPDVRDWDPHLALDGGVDGLDAYRVLAPILMGRLATTGLALLEIAFDQELTATAILHASGLQIIETRHDLSGRPRVLVVKK